MNSRNIFRLSFLNFCILTVIGMVLMQFENDLIISRLILIIASGHVAIFILTALYEIYQSDRINSNEKIMWTVGFIIFNILCGFLYFFYGQPRITRHYKILHHKK
ncbi:PLDc N-terminal domain-containing protein [Pedobacter sp.]|uniref:PLDc N-terminal domain-containing protein n=1 Tax=Pedobacter sp. TaxID=1411316 RepID=UPI003D7FDC3F